MGASGLWNRKDKSNGLRKNPFEGDKEAETACKTEGSGVIYKAIDREGPSDHRRKVVNRPRFDVSRDIQNHSLG